MSKKLMLFTKDEALTAQFAEYFANHEFEAHLTTTSYDALDFTNSVCVLDYDDADNVSMAGVLTQLVKKAGPSNKVLVVSKDCERRNVTDAARRGAHRFIVKPVTKTRIKKYILPYLEYALHHTGDSDTIV